MTGADFFIVIILVVLCWAGSARGVIKEFFEFLIVTVNVLICTHIYGPVADGLSKYAHVPPETAGAMAFIFFFALFAFAFWVAAGKAEIAANLPPSNEMNKFGGVVMAFLKAAVLIWAALFLFSRIPMTPNGRAFFGNSLGVKTIESLNPYVDQAFRVAGSKRSYHYLHPKIEKFKFEAKPEPSTEQESTQ